MVDFCESVELKEPSPCLRDVYEEAFLDPQKSKKEMEEEESTLGLVDKGEEVRENRLEAYSELMELFPGPWRISEEESLSLLWESLEMGELFLCLRETDGEEEETRRSI